MLGFNTDYRGNAPMGPVGHYVILAGRGKMVDQPDPVGPHNRTEKSVVLGLDVDQVEHVPANIMDPGVKLYRYQPVTDGPAGPDRTCRPVGTDGMHAAHDADRPTAGGPVGRLFNLDPLGPSRMRSLDELNQPLAMGPLGTEGIHAVTDSDRPTAGGPVGRVFNLDPLGPSGMSSSDDMIPNINLRGRGEPVNRSGPVGPQNHTEQPVVLSFNTDYRGNAPMGPVGHYVILAGRGKMVDQPDPVGPHNRTEKSVVLGLDVDQVEHVPANIVDPGVKLYRYQPVTDGPAGPDRTRRPVGTDGMHAAHGADRPTAGGPVGCLPQTNGISHQMWALWANRL